MQRSSHRVLLAGIALYLANPVYAQPWPQRPVSFVVPQPIDPQPTSTTTFIVMHNAAFNDVQRALR
jgi:hypothetical protein